MAHSRQEGFTLLEAIVALVLISTTGMALYSWLNSSLISLQRVESAELRAWAVSNTLQRMRLVNPAEKPEGVARVGSDLQVSWQSTPRQPLQDGVSFPDGIGLYQVGLYDTDVRIERAGRLIGRFQLQQFGYKKVRQWQPPF